MEKLRHSMTSSNRIGRRNKLSRNLSARSTQMDIILRRLGLPSQSLPLWNNHKMLRCSQSSHVLMRNLSTEKQPLFRQPLFKVQKYPSTCVIKKVQEIPSLTKKLALIDSSRRPNSNYQKKAIVSPSQSSKPMLSGRDQSHLRQSSKNRGCRIVGLWNS